MGRPIEKLFAGLIAACTITMCVMFGFAALPCGVLGDGFGLRRLLAGVAMAGVLLMLRPALLRVLHPSRGRLLHGAHLDCLLIGRALGMFWGVIGGLALHWMVG